MKLALSVLTLVFSTVSYAGPEDHFQNQTCYGANVKADVVLPTGVPSEICLEDVIVNADEKSISVYSYFQPEVWEDLGLLTLIKRSESEYKFLASKVLSENSDAACGKAEIVELYASGMTDMNGKGNPSAVEISVTHRVTQDSCHLEGETTIYQYQIN